MALGLLIDVPLFGLAFLLTTYYRRGIARAINRIPLPSLLLASLVAVPLLIFEEHVNCIPDWCMQVLIPPTIWFLLIEVVLLLLFVIWKKTSVWKATIWFSIYGVIFELVLGPSRGAGFLGLSIPMMVFMLFWVWISYAFIILIPLTILKKN